MARIHGRGAVGRDGGWGTGKPRTLPADRQPEYPVPYRISWTGYGCANLPQP